MNKLARILSILNCHHLESSVTGFPSFDLSSLHLSAELSTELPDNLRLGHLAERIVSTLINSSDNYRVLFENIQIVDEGRTIGELDFIIESLVQKTQTHLELAYKFYLFDPRISSMEINYWIGPNRNDSLSEKLDKLKSKQFPLLYNKSTAERLKGIEVDKLNQALCFLVSLYIPYEFKASLSPEFQGGLKGYYLDKQTFDQLNTKEKLYCLPPKTEWGMDPSHNKEWKGYDELNQVITTILDGGQAVLCWQKLKEEYLEFFIVWW